MANERVARDAGQLFNQLETRLGRLERRGRGFTIDPEALAGASFVASDTPPTPPSADTLWINTADGSKIYRWNGSAWVPTMDPAVDLDRNAAAAELASWQDDAATADSVVTTWFLTIAPSGAMVGDLWVHTGTRNLYRWTGSAWEDMASTTVGDMYAKAALASTIADGRTYTWWQYNAPVPIGFGDTWVKTSDDPATLWRWNNFEWLRVVDWTLLKVYEDLQGKTSTYYQSTPPTATAIGDIWVDASAGKMMKRWDGTTWVEVQDAGITEAINDAQAAANMADAKMRIFYEPKSPSGTYPASNPTMGPADVGDLWFRTDEGNKPYRWSSGGSWLPFALGSEGIQQTDGLPPSTSPACNVRGGVRCVFLSWSPTANADPVRYRVYGSKTDGFTPDPSNFITETSATVLTVQRVPGEPTESFNPEVTTTDLAYFKIIAVDDDGPSPLIGSQGSGSAAQINSPDIVAEAVTTDILAAGSVIGKHLNGQIVSGSVITTGGIDYSGDPESNPNYGQVIGQRVELRPEGLRLIDAEGNILVNLPTNLTAVEEDDDPERPYIKGTLEAERLTVTGGASFQTDQNRVEKGGAIRLASATTAPSSAPAIAHEYDRIPLQRISTGPADPSTGNLGTFAIDPAQISCWGWHPEWGCWMVAQKRPGGVRIWYYLLDGTLGKDFFDRNFCYDLVGWSDITSLWGYAGDIGGGALGLYGGQWWISGKTGATGTGAWNLNKYPIQNASLKPVATWNQANQTLYVAEGNVTVGSSKLTRIRRVTLSTSSGATVTIPGYSDAASTANSSVQLASLITGSFDFGSPRWVWSWINNATIAMVATTSNPYTPVPDDRFNVATTGFGHLWDGSNFWLLGTDGYLYKYTDWTWGTGVGDYLHAAITWYDNLGTTHETNLGSINTYALRKRAKIRLTMPLVPDLGGVDDPKKWRLYMVQAGIAKPDRTQMIFQTEGGSATEVVVLSMTRPGTASPERPPIEGDFPDSNPAVLATDAKSAFDPLREPFYVDGNGQGRWDYLVPPGSMTMYASDTPLPGSTLPEMLPGWLVCRGDVVSRAAYPALFASIGTTWNTGGELATEFRLPDGQKRYPVGVSPAAGHPIAWTEGRDPTSRTIGHNHTTNISHAHTFSATTSTFTHNQQDNTTTGGTSLRLSGPTGHSHTVSGTTAAGGSTTAASSSYIPPVFTVNYIIKT